MKRRHVGIPKDPAEGIRIVRSAIDRGITFMDNCWDYHDGERERRTPVECLHYALSLPTSVVITGCESVERVDQAVEAARTFKPLSPDQVAALLARTKTAAVTGQFEPFKTTDQFDGTAHNPQWMS